MAASVNKVILVGYVGKLPEIRFSQTNGSKICVFSLATNESWKDKTSGQRIEKTEWHNIKIFNEKLIDIISRYIKKGSKVYLEGQLQTYKWTDQEGKEHFKTEVILGKFKGELVILDNLPIENVIGEGENYESAPLLPSNLSGFESQFIGSSPLNDEIPF